MNALFSSGQKSKPTRREDFNALGHSMASEVFCVCDGKCHCHGWLCFPDTLDSDS